MKNYIKPEIKIETFETEDITSDNEISYGLMGIGTRFIANSDNINSVDL